MSTVTAELLGALVAALNVVQAVIITALFALAIRALLLIVLDRRRSVAVSLLRVCAAVLFLGIGQHLGLLISHQVVEP